MQSMVSASAMLACSAMPAQQPKSLRLFSPSARPPAPRRGSCVILAAKKGSGGGKAKKKGAGSPADPPKVPLPYLSAPVIMQNLLLIENYYRKTGKPLFDAEIEISEAAKALWEAPVAVLAHDTSEPEPVFVYSNKAGLDLFETEWVEFIGVPSSKSALPEKNIQEDRSAAIAAALEKGSISDYSGKRVSFKGSNFTISDATLFNVDAPSGDRVGQAVVIRSWEYEDGRKGGEAALAEAAEAAAAAAAAPPSAEALEAAEAAVVAAGVAVRDLKENQGLGNASEEVKAAVVVLLEKKEALERMKAATEAAAAAA